MGKASKTLVGFILAGLLVLAGAAPANAAVTWVGNSTGPLVFTDANSGVKVTCASGSQRGSATALPAGPLTTVSASTWVNCNLTTGSVPLAMTLTQSGTWTVTPTSVTGVALHFAAASGASSCSFNLSGSVAATYSSSPKIFTYPGTTASLPSSTVIGCFGAIHNGDVWKFAGSYQL